MSKSNKKDIYEMYSVKSQNNMNYTYDMSGSGSMPAGSMPSGSMPMGSMPSGSMPSGSMPSGSMPMGSMPAGSMPSGSMPMGSMPMGSMPMGSMPSGSMPAGSMPMTRENPQPYVSSDAYSGEMSVGGIVNIKYEISDDYSINVSVNIANMIDVGSFTLNTKHPMVNFTQGNSLFGYSLTFGIDYDANEFYFQGYVKIPFISPFETGRFVIYSW